MECLFPDPSADGAVGDLGYEITLVSGCDPVSDPLLIANVSWPFVVTTQDVPADITVQIQRVLLENGEIVQRSKLWTVTPPQQTAGNALLKRWLLHVPRPEGGFDGLLRLHNSHPIQEGSMTLSA